MKITCISIFPELFQTFITSSLIGKSVEKWILTFDLVNPRDFCLDKQKKVDDEIYGGGVGLLMKAEPVIKAIQNSKFKIQNDNITCRENGLPFPKTKIILVWPSPTTFNQQIAHDLSDYDHLIFLCGRYEGIDHRVKLWCQNEFGEDFWFSQNQKSGETTFCEISLGQFVTLWGELPAMTMIEAITRLIPWVIKEEQSRQEESYRPEQNMQNIEYPQYTRPEVVEGMIVPEVLLSGHHKKIEQWKQDQTLHL